MSDMQVKWEERVKQVMPELVVEHVAVNQEGLMNDVVIVNHNLVFRFAKDERRARMLDVELRLLDVIRPRLKVAIPTPTKHGTDVWVYPMLTGEALLFEDILDAEPARQSALAMQVGQFLYDLHSTPTNNFGNDLPTTRAMVTREQFAEFRQDLREKVHPLMQTHQVHWVERFFDRALNNQKFFEYTPVLIHGDLAPYHILYDRADSRVTGVIDFGMAGLGDPASDFGLLMSLYGETFISKMGTTYSELDALIPRARFYAQTIELEWVIRGIETGENFWFTAHLGGARDIRQD